MAESLFPPVVPPVVELSAGWDTPTRRLASGDLAKWSALKLKSDWPCHECAQRQHETRGASGPRRQARHRRKCPAGGTLDLCSAHARLWRERDDEDTARKPT